MNKTLFAITLLLLLIITGIISWTAFQYQQEPPQTPQEVNQTDSTSVEYDLVEGSKQEESKEVTPISETFPPYSGMGNPDSENFPPPSVEVVNGRAERTMHMGVRQYVWEPSTITAKKGELVRLVIHNADVKHGLVIPDLGVMEGDIPPEGAVIEFMASKVGTFEFFCSVWCGEGHMEMRGNIIIQ